MKKWFGRKAVVTALLAAAVAAAAVGVGLKYRAQAGFQPFDPDRELKNNQVLFPDGPGGTGLDKDGDDNRSFWEKDPKEPDTSGGSSGSGYLFSQGDPVPSPSGTVIREDLTATDAPEETPPTGGDVYEIVDKPDDKTDIILPGGDPEPGQPEPVPEPEPDPEATPEPSPAPSPEPTPAPDPGPSPEPEPEPTPTPEPDPGPFPVPDPVPSPSQDPVMGGEVAEDPDETTKTPPEVFGDKTVFDESRLPGDWSDGADESADEKVTIIKAWGRESAALYTGQSVNSRVIYSAMDTYVTGSNDMVYFWDDSSLDRYIRIDAVSFDGEKWYDLSQGQTVTIPGDAESMYLRVFYRLRERDPWRQLVPDPIYTPLEKSRVLVLGSALGEDGKVLPDQVLNLDSSSQNLEPGSLLNLLRWQSDLLRSRGENVRALRDGDRKLLTSLFLGWTEDGQAVDWFYPVTAGRHVLEPLDNVPLDSETYQVELRTYWMDAALNVYPPTVSDTQLSYMQTLTYYTGQRTYDPDTGGYYFPRLEVPRYVQAVDFPYAEEDTDYLCLPDTVLYVNTSGISELFGSGYGLSVRKGYEVADGNPRYTAKDGILYSLDKSEILGVPTEINELRVPAGVTKVVLPTQSRLTRLVLEAGSPEQLPEISYENLRRDCLIVVPRALLNGYLRAEGDLLRSLGLTVCAAENGVGLTVRDSLALDDRGLVHLVLDEGARWLSLPDTVAGLEANALSGLEQLSMVFLPRSGAALTLEPGCFAGAPALETVVCYSEAQYAAALAAAPAGVDVRLSAIAQAGGFSYQVLDDQVLLLSAPADITVFDGTIPTEDGPLTVSAIGESAFAGCESLRWVILPRETTSVGQQAFQGCWRLEGVLLDARNRVMIGVDAFLNCSSLRFVASNAKVCDLKSPELSLPANPAGDYGFLFTVDGATGYNLNWADFDGSTVDHYELVDCGGTRVLYGVNKSGERWLALRSGAVADGVVTLAPESVELMKYAFQDLRSSGDEPVVFDWTGLTQLRNIDSYAFYNSDIGGDMVLPPDLHLYFNSFYGCRKLTSVTIPSTYGGGIDVAYQAFESCTGLTRAVLGDTSLRTSFGPDVFLDCGALRTVEFTGDAVRLGLRSPGFGFRFNSVWTLDEEEQYLTVVTPDAQAQFLAAWRYPFAGYADYDGNTAYQAMWSDAYWDLFDWTTWQEPTNAEVFAEVDRLLLTAENHARALLGMEPVEQVEHTFTFEEDIFGSLTLVGAKGVTSATMEGADMDLPSGWYVDYIGPGAFLESPGLRDVTLPKTLSGIWSGAFLGVEFPEDEQLYLWSYGGQPPALLLTEEGVPFTFGVEDARVGLIDMYLDWDDPESSPEPLDYFAGWLWPLAGYSDEASMRAAFTGDDGAFDEEGYSAALIRAENRLRLMLGEELIPVDPTEPIEPVEPTQPAQPPKDPDEPGEGDGDTGGDEGGGSLPNTLPAPAGGQPIFDLGKEETEE